MAQWVTSHELCGSSLQSGELNGTDGKINFQRIYWYNTFSATLDSKLQRTKTQGVAVRKNKDHVTLSHQTGVSNDTVYISSGERGQLITRHIPAAASENEAKQFGRSTLSEDTSNLCNIINITLWCTGVSFPSVAVKLLLVIFKVEYCLI